MKKTDDRVTQQDVENLRVLLRTIEEMFTRSTFGGIRQEDISSSLRKVLQIIAMPGVVE